MDTDFVSEGTESKKVLVLFSGGRDSILTAARLIADGCGVVLVTFDNGCMRQQMFRDHGLTILRDAYNINDVLKVIDGGIVDICGIWQMLMRPVFNKSFTELSETCKAMSMSQVHCTVCRAAMVAAGAMTCNKLGITQMAVGDKKGDTFAVQHEDAKAILSGMTKDLFGVEYLTPVWDLNDAFEVKSELLLRGLTTKVIEPQCILGCPMEGDIISEAHLADKDCASLLSSVIYPVIEKMKGSWSSILK